MRNKKHNLLYAKKKKELVTLAESIGIKLSMRLRKDEMIKKIEPHLKDFEPKIVEPDKEEGTVSSISPYSEQLSSGSLAEISSKEKKKEVLEGKELPKKYGENRMVAMVRDPRWIFVYWELTDEKLKEVTAKSKGNFHEVLRVYDVTGVKFNGKNALETFDIEVPYETDNWYIQVGNHGRSYIVELGVILDDGKFVPLLRSNQVTTPKAGISNVEDEEWISVREEFERIYQSSLGEDSSSPGLGKKIEKRLKEKIFSGPLPKK